MPGRRVCGGWTRDMWKAGLRSRQGKILRGLVYHFEELTCPIKDGASQVALVVQNPPANAGDLRDMSSIPELGRSSEKEMATYSSILAWRIPWTEEPGGLRSLRLQSQKQLK